MNLLLKTNVGRDRRPNVVILECFNCRSESGEVARWESSVLYKYFSTATLNSPRNQSLTEFLNLIFEEPNDTIVDPHLSETLTLILSRNFDVKNNKTEKKLC